MVEENPNRKLEVGVKLIDGKWYVMFIVEEDGVSALVDVPHDTIEEAKLAAYDLTDVLSEIVGSQPNFGNIQKE